MSHTPKSASCCDMRRKVAIGIAKVFTKEECGVGDEVMLDFHDFSYSSPTKLPVAAALAFKFCPWCGKSREGATEKRSTEVIRQIKPQEDDDPGEAWKKGREPDED